MRISDWSSDVCSSDLVPDGDRADRGCRGVTGERGALFGRPPSYRAALLFLAPARLGRDLAASHVLRLDAAGADRQAPRADRLCGVRGRSEEHTSELQSLMRISYAVFCLKTKKAHSTTHRT